MKKLLLLSVFISLFALQLTAQNPITTLVHAGTSTPYYGQNSLVDAYTAAVNGDYIYLSPGYFTAPTAIAKGVKIIGSGHFPDSANVVKRTTIMSGLTINGGADSLRLEGLYINGDINYAAASSINYVKIQRCRVGNVNFNSSSTSASKNNCSFEECYIYGAIDFCKYGTNLLISHSILQSRAFNIESYFEMSIVNINGAAQIDGNIFIHNSGACVTFGNVKGSLIKNNIILNSSNYGIIKGENNSNKFNNNLFIRSTIDFGNNSYSGNYSGISQSNIFLNQTGNTIDYTHDYHLKSPTTYIGTDGTQVGLYGGTTPFKDKGAPSNPQILTKTVGDQTDTNGNLQINFKVKAQDN